MMSSDEKSNLEVILEDINGKFDLVLEGHATLEHMIHEHRAETRQDKREIQALIQISHDSLDAKINKVSTELKETREEIQAVDRRLTIEVRAVGQKVEGHEDRIRFLERKVA